MTHGYLKQVRGVCAIGALPLLLAGMTACIGIDNTGAYGGTDALCDAAERHYRTSHETAFQYYRAAVNRGSIRAMCKLAERLTQEADAADPAMRKAYAAEAVDAATRGTRMTDADFGWRAGCYVALARLYNDPKYGVYNRAKALDCAREAAVVNPCDFCKNFYSEIAGTRARVIQSPPSPVIKAIAVGNHPQGFQSPASVAGKTIAIRYRLPEDAPIGGALILKGGRACTVGMLSNQMEISYADARGMEDLRVSYSKTGAGTAKLTLLRRVFERDYEKTEFLLTLTSSNSGTVVVKTHHYNGGIQSPVGRYSGTFEISDSSAVDFFTDRQGDGPPRTICR